jgi:hypothetical protein
MAYRIGVRPGKFASIAGMVVGGVFVLLGIALVPIVGVFALVWTAVAAAITIFHGYNVFSRRGASAYEVTVESSEKPSGSQDDLDASLRKLASLRDDGLLTEEEYQRKRAEALGER